MNSFENINNKAKLDDLYKFFNVDRRDPALLWLALRQSQYETDYHCGMSLGGISTTIPGIIKWGGGQVDVRAFNGIGVKTEKLSDSFVFGGNYKKGTSIIPFIKWAPTTAGAGLVLWQLNYDILRDGQISGPGLILTNVTTPTNSTAWEVFTSLLPPILSGGFDIGSVFHFNLFRDPASPGDTYGGDTALIGIGIYKEINTFGARTQFTK